MPLRIATAAVLTSFALGAVLDSLDSARVPPFAILASLCCGFGLGVANRHPYRALGLLLPFLLAASGATATALIHDHFLEPALIVATASLAAASIPLLGRPIQYRAILQLWIVSLTCLVSLATGKLMAPEAEWIVAVCGSVALFSLVAFFRPTFELACEPLLWFMFRVRAVGDGKLPPRGPCIVIANHACWFDPLFLAKVLPRPITAMMISRFFDLPMLRPLLRHVFHTIRVPDHHYRKEETPEEIREAIAALDRGECLVLFPEGFLRRTEEKPLRRFGRGIWQILRARPETPVFCCWIEGAWGSYTSYFNGPPTKNKRRDFRRPIRVAVPPPIVVDREVLANHMATRFLLMNHVLAARQSLGLPAVPPFELPSADDEAG